MHIAWLGKKTPFCGNVTYSREITTSLVKRGYKVSFLHFSQDNDDSEQDHYSTEVSLPFLYKSQIYTIPAPKSSKILLRSLRELQPDLVHASLTLSPLDFTLPEICQKLNIPLVATFHPPFDSRLRNLKSSTQYLTYQLYAPCLAKYDQTIIFSELQRDLLVKLGVPREKLAIIPNGVDTQKYSPGKSYFKQQHPNDLLYVYQGRIAVEKNVESLLRAWKHSGISQQGKLLIIGDGPLTPNLKPLYNQDDNVIWLGAIVDEEKRIDILRGADVFILPSLVEGLSLSLLEGMSCGLACVATDAGADGEVLANAGIVISTQDVTTQLKTILPLFSHHPEINYLLGEKARKRVLEKYTLSDNVTKLEHLYSKL
ncbi:glycosyltransferase family 4 protein [Cyanobacterium aponinum UTEX 3222]|uniref:Glycosyl transferase group 1 n=3 Tax=Cyanobacterium aponinum TaxID=379064 RepID=K9Z8V8_CYAAP|nr:glycosyltransferase family 4 protein [Cyanobacterium aponinum]WRL43220.1 glycosyltransferase family 4 protein [Cyanobacterium aponinum UTEX 3222]AFZ54798.1 glycosyl transferase group 1 [Cyanobacterium aponinum PCC 10605]MBD2395558.1 glycosyltransferase family 4 protein [Cyanobacterium aponinum FACHB-4101]MTF38250.1 glycosyltransferase [Cyanobacterium aponinum 0216]PHV64060.1 glycosyltransferase family 1 protein [Cyanobacterium aponinum IPPAS B-1201]